MSLFRTAAVSCPSCGAELTFDAVHSVNADRRPDYRDAILDDTFQFETCISCKATFRLDPSFVYLDVGRDQWIAARPSAALGDWPEEETIARDLMAASYGSGASTAAQEVGANLRPRVTFGWAALREKLVLRDLGLDDLGVELTKAALIRTQPDLKLSVGRELRLHGVTDDGETLVFQLRDAQNEAVIDQLAVPMGFLTHIQDHMDAWGETAQFLADSPFVDVQKLYIGEGRPDPVVEAEPEPT